MKNSKRRLQAMGDDGFQMVGKNCIFLFSRVSGAIRLKFFSSLIINKLLRLLQTHPHKNRRSSSSSDGFEKRERDAKKWYSFSCA
jgi:hypothetical protein